MNKEEIAKIRDNLDRNVISDRHREKIMVKLQLTIVEELRKLNENMIKLIRFSS